MDFKTKLQEYKKFTEDNLKKYNQVTKENEPQRRLVDAMNYSLEAGGKRIRPALVYAFCNALGGDYKNAKAPACALEMIHTFSLIHDDLPAMDDDDYRRGRPSCHKEFDEATAILAGDALLALPFETIAKAPELDAQQKVQVIAELAKACGRDGMTGGQMIDLENEQRDDVDEANLRNMYHNKTGQLIAVACVMGCICAGANQDKIEAAREYGFKLGLAFQIVDDILDVTSTQEELGKPIGSDAEQNKTTFVTLHGVEGAQKIAAKITDEALALLKEFNDDEFLIQLTNTLLKRTN